MTIDPNDVPDMIRIDAASIGPFETARRSLDGLVAVTSSDPEWVMTNDEQVPDYGGLGLNVRATWEHVRTGRFVEIETRRGIARLSLRLVTAERDEPGPVIRIPRAHDHGHDQPAAVLEETLAVLDATARRLARSGDQRSVLESWARGCAAIADAAFGTRTTTVRFVGPLEDVRIRTVEPSADGRRRPTGLETCEGTLPIAHPEAAAIAAVAPNAYNVASDITGDGRPDVRVMPNIQVLRHIDPADDPVGTMRAVAFVRAALDAGRRS